jgi:hypothetical protein
MSQTRLLVSALVIILIGAAIWFAFFGTQVPTPTPQQTNAILSFEDCANAGYPIMESYPRQCKTPDGRTFAEEIMQEVTYVNATKDMISVETPTPGSVTGKTFSVIGQARGTWYFEASFPVEILDANGNTLVTAPAQAQGDWMTENFVPFKIDLTTPETYTGPATVVLKKDNPSGEADKDASISFPITIEY